MESESKSYKKTINVNKQNLDKKCKLLKEKIIANSQINQNINQYRIEQLKERERQGRLGLRSYLKELQQEVEKLCQSYQIFIKKIAKKINQSQSLEDSSQTMETEKYFNGVSSSVITCSNIKKYLNIQKNALKQIINLYSEGQTIPNSENQLNSKEILHKMSKTKKLELILGDIHQKQLQRQIRYLDEQVCGNYNNQSNKQSQKHILYIPDEYMSDKEEQQYNKKIQILLAEVERLVDLQEICAEQQISSNKNSKQRQIESYLKALSKQNARLLKAEEFIADDLNKIQKSHQYIENFDNFLTNMPGLSNKKQNKKINNRLHKQTDYVEQNDEIALILQTCKYSIQNPMSSRVCSEQQIANALKGLKNRVKRLGI